MPTRTPRTEGPGLAARLRAYRLLHGLAVGVFVLDQLTKLAIAQFSGFPVNLYPPFGGVEVIPGWFNIVHVRNPGAAWGVLAGQVELLSAFAFASLFAIYAFRRMLGLRERLLQVSFGLLVGGILGNLIDRLLFGMVIDFIDVILPGGYRYPTFNVADMAIVGGCAVYLWVGFRNPDPRQDDGRA